MSRNIIIFVRDRNSKVNKELMNFLHKNIKTTARCGNSIVHKIIPKNKEKEFQKKYKINKLPAMIYNNVKYVGNKSIRETLKLLCTSRNTSNEKSQEDLDLEAVQEHRQQILDSGPDEDMDDNEDIEKRKQAAAVMTEERKTIREPKKENHYKDMDGEYGNVPISARPDNIGIEADNNEDLNALIHDDAGGDDQYMDAFLEKIQGAGSGGI